MIDLEKMVQTHDMVRARTALLKMLTALSDEALRYVWRPISYAYYWTDEHAEDMLTSDDIKRLGLLIEIASAEPDMLDALDSYRLRLVYHSLKKAR